MAWLFSRPPATADGARTQPGSSGEEGIWLRQSRAATCNSGDGLPATAACKCGLQYDDENVVRTSVGVGLIWASPFGPLRFDYAVPITKGKYDIVQEFRFGGGTSF